MSSPEQPREKRLRLGKASGAEPSNAKYDTADDPTTSTHGSVTSMQEHKFRTRLEHEPLDETKSEIRLLRIKSSEDEQSPIRCTLEHASCNESWPAYTALSYCWGGANSPITITVNGCAVPVTRNLEAALSELRNRNIDLLWVDALCINQDDVDERGHQVFRMKDIYCKAVRTIAWLGPDDCGYAVMAFECLRILETKEPRAEYDEIKADVKRRPHDKSKKSDRAIAARRMIGLPYWKRTWIIQEVILSANLIFMWGKSTMGSDTFKYGLQAYAMHRSRNKYFDGWDQVKGLMRIMHKSNNGDKNGSMMGLQRALNLTSLSQAMDPRDKVRNF